VQDRAGPGVSAGLVTVKRHLTAKKGKTLMDRKSLIIMARKHWEEWLPEKTQGLKEVGEFKAATRVAARRAQAEIADLMARGFQQHEAEEVVLPKHILLEPDPLTGQYLARKCPLAA
jgi:hypothetical protein